MLWPRSKSQNNFSPKYAQYTSFESLSSLAAEVNVQGEFETLATLREMLQMQERMFKSFFDSIVTNVNTRLDSLTHSVAELKARIASSEKETGVLENSLEFSLKDIDDLKPSLLKLQELDSAIEEIQDDLDHQEEQMEYLENQSRRNNVRVDGIPEEDNETREETEAKVKQVLKDELNLPSAPDIERAHRVGKSSRRPASAQNSASRPRTIVCRLRDWKERETILKCARRIKPDNIFVKEDLSPATLEKRESQRPKMEAAKRAGKIAYFVLEKLVIRDGPNVENS